MRSGLQRSSLLSNSTPTEQHDHHIDSASHYLCLRVLLVLVVQLTLSVLKRGPFSVALPELSAISFPIKGFFDHSFRVFVPPDKSESLF